MIIFVTIVVIMLVAVLVALVMKRMIMMETAAHLTSPLSSSSPQACRFLLSKCALRRARAASLSASACVIQRTARRHWQRAKLAEASAGVTEELLQRRLRRAVTLIVSRTRGFMVRRKVSHAPLLPSPPPTPTSTAAATD